MLIEARRSVFCVRNNFFGLPNSIYLFLDCSWSLCFPHGNQQDDQWEKKNTSTNQTQIISSLLADAKPLNLILEPRFRFSHPSDSPNSICAASVTASHPRQGVNNWNRLPQQCSNFYFFPSPSLKRSINTAVLPLFCESKALFFLLSLIIC